MYHHFFFYNRRWALSSSRKESRQVKYHHFQEKSFRGPYITVCCTASSCGDNNLAWPVFDPGHLLVAKRSARGRSRRACPTCRRRCGLPSQRIETRARVLAAFVSLEGERVAHFTLTVLPPRHKQRFGDGGLFPLQRAAACVRGSDHTVGGALVDVECQSQSRRAGATDDKNDVRPT